MGKNDRHRAVFKAGDYLATLSVGGDILVSNGVNIFRIGAVGINALPEFVVAGAGYCNGTQTVFLVGDNGNGVWDTGLETAEIPALVKTEYRLEGVCNGGT